MRVITFLLFACGLTAAVALVAYYGIGDVAAALASAKWGVFWVCVFHVVPLVTDTIAWRWLLPAAHRKRLRDLVWMRWVSESINNLLPAAQIGGDLARARLAAQRCVPAAHAVASIVADLTTSVLTLIAFGVLGALLLFPNHRETSAGLVLGLAISAAVISVQSFLYSNRSNRSALCHIGVRLMVAP